jgi:hypothetical protein
MTAMLPAEVLQDAIAVSLARIVAVANQRASEAGVDVEQSLITITQYVTGEAYWRVNYGPRESNMRGGDFIVDVDAGDATVKRVLLGQ